jgi:hypothetical protein
MPGHIPGFTDFAIGMALDALVKIIINDGFVKSPSSRRANPAE